MNEGLVAINMQINVSIIVGTIDLEHFTSFWDNPHKQVTPKNGHCPASGRLAHGDVSIRRPSFLRRSPCLRPPSFVTTVRSEGACC